MGLVRKYEYETETADAKTIEASRPSAPSGTSVLIDQQGTRWVTDDYDDVCQWLRDADQCDFLVLNTVASWDDATQVTVRASAVIAVYRFTDA